MEISNDKENNSLNLDFSNFDIISKDNKEEEINNSENEDINLSKIDFEDTNDLYMPDEKLDLSNNKNDMIEELINEIKINNKKSDDSNKADNKLKNIFLQCNTNFSTKISTYNNETLSNDKKGKTFINKKTKRK